MTSSTLAAQLARRATSATKPACESPDVLQVYNFPLHIGAVFIILAVSGSACAFPLIVVKFPRLRIPPTFLFIVRHFGTGVLIATAFVHLLPTAFLNLTDPCLPSFWNEQYPAMAGALALAAVFMIAVVEMVFSPGKNGCAMPHALMEANLVRGDHGERAREGCAEGHEKKSAVNVSRREGERRPPAGIIHGRNSSTGRELQRVTKNSAALDELERKQLSGTDNPKEVETDGDATPRIEEESNSQIQTSEQQKHKKALLQCMMLEMGILFHSVFIGMALSVATGNDFIVLLIAITFHQTFEGLALGSRIAALTWSKGAWQPWLMAFAYGCTTPIGQALGLATHTLYRPGSQVGLLMVGIMNAISAGLLTFTSLVDLMSEDFLSDESWTVLRGRKRVWACVLVGGGAFGMSLIGAWA